MSAQPSIEIIFSLLPIAKIKDYVEDSNITYGF